MGKVHAVSPQFKLKFDHVYGDGNFAHYRATINGTINSNIYVRGRYSIWDGSIKNFNFMTAAAVLVFNQ